MLNDITDDTELPSQDKKFWCSEKNCMLVQNYLFDFIMKNFSYFPGNSEIIINGKNNECETSNVTRVKASIKMLNKFVDEGHERMIIHTNHAVNEGHKQIKIIGEDSDCVALLLQNWKTWATQGLKVSYNKSLINDIHGGQIIQNKIALHLLVFQ